SFVSCRQPSARAGILRRRFPYPAVTLCDNGHTAGWTDLRRAAADLGAPFGVETVELRCLHRHVWHRLRDRTVAGLLADQGMHLQRDLSIRGMALRRRPKLQQVDGLARVELHRIAESVRHGYRV